MLNGIERTTARINWKNHNEAKEEEALNHMEEDRTGSVVVMMQNTKEKETGNQGVK